MPADVSRRAGRPRPPNDRRRFTLVSFHAHPDDEALLTGGTLARAAAEGHRVVLVTATAGERGLGGAADGTGRDLGQVRSAELAASARALGCARVVELGHPDSGLHPDTADPAASGAFALLEVEALAGELAAILVGEQADVLTVYDGHGGYGHPDHVQVHRVGTRAAALAGTPVVLEATAPAGAFRAVLGLLGVVRHALGGTAPLGTEGVFTPGRSLTHRVDVRAHLDAKRAALGAHASQQRDDGGGSRVVALLLALPRWLFRVALGHEWYVEQGRRPGQRLDDVFASLR